MEKLIEAGDEDGPKESNRPRAKSVDGHLHVVRVGYGGPHLWVGRFIFPLWRIRKKMRFATRV
jgi:hypothetical protein